MNVSKIQFSEMVNGFKTGIFATLNEKKEELIKEGRKVYNLCGDTGFQAGSARNESNAGRL